MQPCVNPETTNIDVCCRDPNYVDPWPQNMPMKPMNGQPMQAQQPAQQPAQPQQQQGGGQITPRIQAAQMQNLRRKSSGGYGRR